MCNMNKNRSDKCAYQLNNLPNNKTTLPSATDCVRSSTSAGMRLRP